MVIYMPHAKFASRAVAWKLSSVDNYYPEINQAAMKEMHWQVGEMQIDPRTGLAWRGVLVCHLVIPSDYAGTVGCNNCLAHEVSENTCTHVMDYYRPVHDAIRDTKFGLNRKLTRTGYMLHIEARSLGCITATFAWRQLKLS